MYSSMFSSLSPFSSTKELPRCAAATAGLLLSASLHRTSPAMDLSCCTTEFSSAVSSQKTAWSSLVVLGKRLVPCSNCSTTRTDVLCFRMCSSSMTTFTAAWKISLVLSALDLPSSPGESSSRSRGTLPARLWARCGGAICSRASMSSWGTAGSRCRKTPTVLRSSSTAMRFLSPGRGPMVPKIGSIENCVAQCVTTCSASSALPKPVAPSITTTPPSAKGLPGGAWARAGPQGTVCSGLWMALLNGPPSMPCTWAIPAHWLMLHRLRTLILEAATGSLVLRFEPSMGLSYQGKRIFRFAVNPTGSTTSLRVGLKIAIGFALPLTLMGASAL
mmetsp:Transcript_79313/g.204291  ORF Transcript_79313/g.204291 Transcript_79313/m.204291 type:complete len:332 (-) Transcript_79313:969-1964(-)